MVEIENFRGRVTITDHCTVISAESRLHDLFLGATLGGIGFPRFSSPGRLVHHELIERRSAQSRTDLPQIQSSSSGRHKSPAAQPDSRAVRGRSCYRFGGLAESPHFQAGSNLLSLSKLAPVLLAIALLILLALRVASRCGVHPRLVGVSLSLVPSLSGLP